MLCTMHRTTCSRLYTMACTVMYLSSAWHGTYMHSGTYTYIHVSITDRMYSEHIRVVRAHSIYSMPVHANCVMVVVLLVHNCAVPYMVRSSSVACSAL